MTGSRFFVVAVALAFLSATLVGVWTIQNVLLRQQVNQITDELREILSATRDATGEMTTDERILAFRAQLVDLNSQLDRQLHTRGLLLDRARLEDNVEALHAVLEEMREVIEQSQQTQRDAQLALLGLTEQYGIKINELERSTGAVGFDFLAGLGAALGLIGAVSAMALGWRKDAREAAEARHREKEAGPSAV